MSDYGKQLESALTSFIKDKAETLKNCRSIAIGRDSFMKDEGIAECVLDCTKEIIETDPDFSKIKIEINTFERSPAFGYYFIKHDVDSSYYKGSANVRTFHQEELVATKIRALYQRSKGRDLYDIWLALSEMNLSPEKILEAFPIYRPEDITAKSSIDNLHAKLSDRQFTTDINNLIRRDAPEYDVQQAGEYIERELLSKL